MIDAVLFDVGGVLIGPKAVTVTRLLWELAAVRVPPRVAARSFAVADRAAPEGGVAMGGGTGWARHWARALFVPDEVGEAVHRRGARGLPPRLPVRPARGLGGHRGVAHDER